MGLITGDSYQVTKPMMIVDFSNPGTFNTREGSRTINLTVRERKKGNPMNFKALTLTEKNKKAFLSGNKTILSVSTMDNLLRMVRFMAMVHL